MSKIKSRKLWVAMGLFVVSTCLLVLAYVENQQWIDMAKWVFGIYAGGNVGEHAADAIKRQGTSRE